MQVFSLSNFSRSFSIMSKRLHLGGNGTFWELGRSFGVYSSNDALLEH
jgi:hypothetical protein